MNKIHLNVSWNTEFTLNNYHDRPLTETGLFYYRVQFESETVTI